MPDSAITAVPNFFFLTWTTLNLNQTGKSQKLVLGTWTTVPLLQLSAQGPNLTLHWYTVLCKLIEQTD
jgi:hypothetical protein